MNQGFIDDHLRKSIEELYKHALLLVTVKDQDYVMVVFDKTAEGRAQREDAARAFTKAHGVELREMEDQIEVSTKDGLTKGPSLTDEDTYPAFYLPTKQLLEEGKEKQLPEISVLMDMAHYKPKNAAQKVVKRPMRLSDKIAQEKAQINPPKPEAVSPFELVHVEGTTEDYGKRAEHALKARESAFTFTEETKLLPDLNADHPLTEEDGIPDEVSPKTDEEIKKKFVSKLGAREGRRLN